jgi:4-deoxy-L-threo-5-hexosulose-uronate ketol-isomerase
MVFETRHNTNPLDARGYDSARMAREFLQERVFSPDELRLTYTHVDRMIFGGAMPAEKELTISSGKMLHAETFLGRREMGVINIGGPGGVIVDGAHYPLAPRDGLYVGMGAERVDFKSLDAANPAKFYICCAPAHHSHPTRAIALSQTLPAKLGSRDECNARTLYKYVHPGVLPSCQLSMGLTVLEKGSVWNTMPCHTHERRMEVYLYFDMPADAAVFHMLGEPGETRHIVARNEQAVISPSWSLHCGCGTSSYSFIWGMAGENQDFDDMDAVPMDALR